MSTKLNKRIVFVDIARSFAIILALFDHSMNDFNIWTNFSFEKYASIKIFTSSATPTFLFLFGMMLELIYFKRLNKVGLDGLVPKLVKRSFQCYLGYALTALAGLIGGFLTYKFTLAALVFFGKAHYGNILKLYTFFMFLAIPILLFRKTYGINKLVMLALSFWILYPLFGFIHIRSGSVSTFTSTLFGIGGKEGPSILFSTTIVVLGMLAAHNIDPEKPFKVIKFNLLLMLILLAILGSSIYFVGWQTFVENYFSNHYRYINHPLYYIVGIILALFFTTAFALLYPVGSHHKKWVDHFLIFGRHSLSAFTIGNIILNISKQSLDQFTWNVSGPILFILFVFSILQAIEYTEKKETFQLAILTKVKLQWNKFVMSPISNKIIFTFSRSNSDQ